MTIRSFFDEAVAAEPDRTFLRWSEGDSWRTWTYAEFRERVVRLHAALVKSGLDRPGTDGLPPRLAIMRGNSPDWLALYLAIAGAGLTAVPMDPKLRGDEARHILEDSGAAAVFTDAHSEAAVAEAALGIRHVAAAELERLADGLAAGELDEGRRRFEAAAPGDGTLASVIYTSGTTGRPKGAMLTHGNFTANVDQTFPRVMFHGSDSFLLVLPLFHAFAFTMSFLLPLRKRAEISFARNLRTVAADILAVRPTVLMAVPLMADLLCARAKAVVCTLRVLGIGGAPATRATIDAIRAAGVRVVEGYGITECSPGVAYPREDAYVTGTVGTPLDGMEWRICNSDETGAGELRVKGPNVMRGYWNNPAATAEAFDADGFYRTGDIVRTGPDGNLSICGRTKALIVNREGKNIYPEEIERVLEGDRLLRDVLVVGYRVGGDVGEHVGAIVVPDPDAVAAEFGGQPREAVAAAVRRRVLALCRRSLADYKLPRKVEVRSVPLERTPSMKIKRFVYKRALDE